MVRISAGEQCEKGCGQDRCTNAVSLTSGKLINLGERFAPLNGAEWTSSPQWNLTRKMGTAFTPELMTGLESAGGNPAPAKASLAKMQSVIAAMGTTLDSAGVGPKQASFGVSVAETKTRSSLRLSLAKVKTSVAKAARAATEWTDRAEAP